MYPNPFLWLINEIVDLYKIILIIYIIATWLINFNVISASNQFVYSAMAFLYRLCEPSLKLVKKYIPNFGNIDISPIIVFILLTFFQKILFYYFGPGSYL